MKGSELPNLASKISTGIIRKMAAFPQMALVIYQGHFTKNRTLTKRAQQEVFLAVTEAFANFDFARLDDICLSAQITFLEHQIARLISTGPEFPFGFGVLGVHQRL